MKVLAGVSLSFLLLAAAADVGIRGFPHDLSRSERTWEDIARHQVQPARIRQYLQRMASRPHPAGSPGSKAVAGYIAGLLRSWGLTVRVEEFEVLLPVPTERSVEMIEPRGFRAALREPPIATDENPYAPGENLTFNAFSASGDVTAPLVYVNYGLPEDYEYLRTQGIDARGKIVLARYGVTWRGFKPALAHAHGAVGCLIYSDPRDDGYYAGDVFPRGPFRPIDGVQRGSVLDLAFWPGDPFTPGWAAEKNARRLPIAEAKSIQKIPVQPLSAGDARPLLRALDGPVAPENWRGALPLTYHLGPGPAKVRLRAEFDWRPRTIYDVVGEIRGTSFPDQWVIYGNHHDAWVNGAADPGSAASALLETARVLGDLLRRGWQPRRTLLFAFWDAEEYGLIGSTEWTEKHAAEIGRNAVVYLNSDSSGRGRLQAGGSPILEKFVAQVAGDVPDPSGGTGLWQKDSHLMPLGSGSDYTPFLHHLGVSSLNFAFVDPSARGCYHSAYDDLYWYEHFSDSTFVFGRALAQLNATALIRLADAPVLPFHAGGLVSAVSDALEEIEKLNHGRKVSLVTLRAELDNLKHVTASFETHYARVLPQLQTVAIERLADINGRLFRLERMLAPSGLPGRPWYKHRIYAPGIHTGYGGVMLPGVRESVEAQRELAVSVRDAR